MRTYDYFIVVFSFKLLTFTQINNIYMKNTFLFLGLSFLFLTGCSTDDSDDGSNAAQCSGSITASNIVGTWNYSSLFTDGTTVTTTPAQTSTTRVKVTSVSSTATFTFNADGTFSSNGVMTVRDNVDGTNAPATRDLPQSSSGNYEITSTNEFIFSNVSGSGTSDTTFQVKRLDSGQFCLEAIIDESFGNGSTFSQVSTGNSYLGFTK